MDFTICQGMSGSGFQTGSRNLTTANHRNRIQAVLPREPSGYSGAEDGIRDPGVPLSTDEMPFHRTGSILLEVSAVLRI